MRYFFWFWSRVIQLAFFTLGSRKQQTRQATSFLDELEMQFGGHFQPLTRRKIAVSYGIYTPMVCDAFARLGGRLTTREEKRRYMLYFVCSSLFDDFTDYGLITPEQLYRISFQPETYHPGSFDEKVFRYAHDRLRQGVQQKEAYEKVTRALFEAQRRSRAQAGQGLDPEALKQITFEKGGNSVLLCRYYLAGEHSSAEEACWYQIGVLIQLTNDLYDIHKDLQEGFSTPANQMSNAYEFEAFFTGQIHEMKKRIADLPCPRTRLRTFSLSMAGIYAFGLIALDQLKRIQGTPDAVLDLKTLPREALIVDMEKTRNLLRWFKFTYRSATLS